MENDKNAPKRYWMIEQPDLEEDDDYKRIHTTDLNVYPDAIVLGEYRLIEPTPHGNERMALGTFHTGEPQAGYGSKRTVQEVTAALSGKDDGVERRVECIEMASKLLMEASRKVSGTPHDDEAEWGRDCATYASILKDRLIGHAPPMTSEAPYCLTCRSTGQGNLEEPCPDCKGTGYLASEAVGRDWLEDFTHENGNYECACCICKNSFVGHKRRVVCKSCALVNPINNDWSIVVGDWKDEKVAIHGRAGLIACGLDAKEARKIVDAHNAQPPASWEWIEGMRRPYPHDNPATPAECFDNGEAEGWNDCLDTITERVKAEAEKRQK